LTEMRKARDGQLGSIAKIMKAEAAEKGQQFSEVMNIVEAWQKDMEMAQNINQPEPAQGTDPNAMGSP